MKWDERELGTNERNREKSEKSTLKYFIIQAKFRRREISTENNLW